MPVLAAQHQPGGWRSSGKYAYTPSSDWPGDCLVQWGASGLVLCPNGSYSTAFFEAFPRNPNTFIRGEGPTIAEAEASALAKWRRQSACLAHEFERRSYRNGAGICKHCGLFKPEVFEPLERCVICSKPTYYTCGEDAEGATHWYCEAHEALRDRKLHPSPVDRLLADDPDDASAVSDIAETLTRLLDPGVNS